MAEDTIYAYKVSGADSFRNAGKWKKINEGEKLLETTWIKLGANAELTLIKPNGYKTIKGQYISRISEIIFKKNDEVWTRLYSGLYKIFTTKPRQSETVISKGNEYQLQFPAEGELLMKETVVFTWAKNSNFTHYFLLTVVPYTDTILYRNNNILDQVITLPDTNIFPGLPSFDRSKAYLWSATNVGNKQSNFIQFSFASIQTRDSLFSDLYTLEQSDVHTDKDIYALIQASCYEYYHFYTEANQIYVQALITFSGSRLIIDAYEKFLNRIHELNAGNL